MSGHSNPKTGNAALPEKWIIPIRISAYLALAGSCGYIYWNSRELEMTHYMIFLAIAAVCAMALLDCRMSVDHWDKKKLEDAELKKRQQSEQED